MKCSKSPHDQSNQSPIAPWQDSHEGFESSEMITQVAIQNKQEQPQHRILKKLTNIEGRDKFILKRHRRNTSFNKQRYRIKLNTLAETQEQTADVMPANLPREKSRPQTRNIERDLTIKRGSVDMSRFSTITVEDISKSLKNTIKFFKQALQDAPLKNQTVPKIVQRNRFKTQTKRNKPTLTPEKATIVMPVLNLYSLPSQQLNLYSFSFFRNSKLTQSCERRPRRSILLRNLFPTIS